MSIRHKYIVLLLVMVNVLSYPIRSYAYDSNRPEHVISNDRITLGQFSAFINLLGSHLADDTSSITSFYDTGIEYSDGEDVSRSRKALMALFCVRLSDANAFTYEGGASSVTAKGVIVKDNSIVVQCHAKYGNSTIKAGWCPGSDPYSAYEQHMQAWNILQEIAAAVPTDDVAAYAYFNDELCRRITYGKDTEGYCATPYGALVQGRGTCSAYAKCFYILCHMTGRKCMIVVAESHERNVVYIDGAPKWVDVTWNDSLGWNKYLLTDISQEGLDYINLPGTAYRFTS